MSLHYPDILPDVFIIVSISYRPSGPGHISYFILGMNLRVPIRGEKDTTLFALNQLKFKSKTHNSGPWEVLYPRVVKRSLAFHRQHQISRENPWMVDSESTLFSLGKSIVLEHLIPSGQNSPAGGGGGGMLEPENICGGWRTSDEIGDPLMRCSLSSCSHPHQDLPGVLKGKQGPMPRAEITASLGSHHLPGVSP